MEIKERIVKIINSEGISPSSFADIIGVQRSSISHILSGRNNPGLEILQKILLGFPKYNAEWLITGKGEIYKKPTQATLFDNINVNANKDRTIENEQVYPEFPPSEIVNNQLDSEIASKIPEKLPEIAQLNDNIDLKIEKIAIFYNNGTFQIYKPN
jgi:transcriptional regulator with XRE-family HTH domain